MVVDAAVIGLAKNATLPMEGFSCFQRQGGTRSRILLGEGEPIMAWAELHLKDWRVIYLQVRWNTEADLLSRNFPDPNGVVVSPTSLLALDPYVRCSLNRFICLLKQLQTADSISPPQGRVGEYSFLTVEF